MIKLKSLLKNSHYLIEANARIMYHGTNVDIANKAWKRGLIPGGSIDNRRRNYDDETTYEKGVYLTSDFQTAAHFGGKTGRDVVILSIDIRKLNSKKLKPDLNAQDSFFYTDIIPPNAIVDWKPLNDEDKNQETFFE